MWRPETDKGEVPGERERVRESESKRQGDDAGQVATMQTPVNSDDVAPQQRQSGSRVDLFAFVDTVAETQ